LASATSSGGTRWSGPRRCAAGTSKPNTEPYADYSVKGGKEHVIRHNHLLRPGWQLTKGIKEISCAGREIALCLVLSQIRFWNRFLLSVKSPLRSTREFCVELHGFNYIYNQFLTSFIKISAVSLGCSQRRCLSSYSTVPRRG
jgi:hypothetical protein